MFRQDIDYGKLIPGIKRVYMREILNILVRQINEQSEVGNKRLETVNE